MKILSGIRTETIKIPIAALFMLFVFGIKNTVSSQVFSDAGLWTNLNFEKGLSSKFTFLAAEGLRFRENLSQLNLIYTDLGVEYKITKNLGTTLVYRASQKLEPEGFFSFRHRIQWDVTIKKKVRRLGFSYRHRLQANVRNVYSSETGYLPRWFSRNKFQVKYELNKYFVPYCSVELRQRLKFPQNPELNYTFYRNRYQAGVDYNLSSSGAIGLYYFLQDEFNIKYPNRLYIVGIEYTLKL